MRLFVFSGTNENPTAACAHWVLPTAAYVEKDGTFVNCHGRVQRIGRAFPPLPDSREDWSVLLEIARRLNHPLPWRNPQEIFLALAEAVPPFAGLSYETIGSQGAQLAAGSPKPRRWRQLRTMIDLAIKLVLAGIMFFGVLNLAGAAYLDRAQAVGDHPGPDRGQPRQHLRVSR